MRERSLLLHLLAREESARALRATSAVSVRYSSPLSENDTLIMIRFLRRSQESCHARCCYAVSQIMNRTVSIRNVKLMKRTILRC